MLLLWKEIRICVQHFCDISFVSWIKRSSKYFNTSLTISYYGRLIGSDRRRYCNLRKSRNWITRKQENCTNCNTKSKCWIKRQNCWSSCNLSKSSNCYWITWYTRLTRLYKSKNFCFTISISKGKQSRKNKRQKESIFYNSLV